MQPSTVKEFVEIVKAKPGGYSYASAGFGTTHHLAAELFKIAADVDLVGVTYRGAAPANQDVIAGHIPIVFDNLGNAMNNIHAGNVRALAITADQRAPHIAEVPTMAEAGVPNVVVSSWFALFVPAGTPKDAIAWLNQQANEVFSAPDVREQFARQGVTIAARHARSARRPRRGRNQEMGRRGPQGQHHAAEVRWRGAERIT